MSSVSPLRTGGSRVDTLPDGLPELMQEPAVGDVIGLRYQLIAELGQGAMGRVFLAENTAIGIQVAIKLLRPTLLQHDEFRRRFQQEAEAVAAIVHPNVARCFDLVVGDPTFMVMEYVPGETLSALLKREGRLSPLRAVSIGCRLCWGLDAAHAAGVVHRDLKPPNIIIKSDAEVGEMPKIIDFGLAKVAAMAEQVQTRAGQIVGAPQYMSPEQIRGEPIDARSDVYSLGCVMFEILTGAPLCGKGPGNDDVQVMYYQLNQVPPPLVELVPDIPPELAAVVARALAKEPADRFASVREMAHALSRAVDRRRARAAADTPPAGTRSGAPRWAPFAFAAAAAALAAGLTYYFTRARPPPARPQPREVLLITSEPPGAAVLIDGRELGETTPTALRGISPAEHTVELRAVGHAAVQRSLTLGPAERAQIHVVLPPMTRRVHVRALPAGGTVFLDGDLVAPSTPATIDVNPDDFHELRIEKNGFEPWTQAITPDDRATEIVATLQVERRPQGLLTIETTEAAEIWLDGVETGFVTPTRIPLRIAPGAHEIELRESSGRRARTTVDIKQGEILHLTLELSRGIR